jgi:thiol-disulfide isomerase/thioredoxin
MSKPIKITLYHANWCHYCVEFMDEWNIMSNNEKAKSLIDFEAIEENEMSGSPKINDEEVSGYPTIKIELMDSEYNYQGNRDKSDIYDFLINELKKKVSTTNTEDEKMMSETSITISSIQ